ncbi:hypothetical protein [Neorhodopirellula lusitana]|nr:hypothetical protein [Neorhodopirellula lusitana]
MIRTLAVSIGSLAMGLVVLRGVIRGELAANVAEEAIIALIVFLGVGALAGAIADYLIRDTVESLYRKRVQWYREGVAELMNSSEAKPEDTNTKPL